MAFAANDSWKVDEDLKKDLETYVAQNLKRTEVLDFVEKKYSMYTWSLRTLCRRLSFFEIKYIDHQVQLDDLRHAVQKEVEGPGRLLGYRALHKKIREVHNLNVPRNLVYAMMEEVDPEGLEERSCVGKRKRPPKGAFTSKVFIILRNICIWVIVCYTCQMCGYKKIGKI